MTQRTAKVNRNSLCEQVREILLGMIGDGTLAPGERIVEARLAAEIGVSSIPVREAIRELAAMGILESTPHKGARVRQVSFSETIEALQVRSALEPLAASLAAAALPARSGELRREAKAIVAAARKRDFVAFQHHNQAFHRAIFESSGNRVLLKVCDSLAFEVRTRAIMDFLKADPVAIAEEHARIVDAIEGGATLKVASLLASHDDHLIEYLRRQLGETAAAG